MHILDFAIILVFIIYSITAGLRARRKASKNLEEYFLAGRSVPGWKAGLSMAATQFAADTPLLVMGLIATAGIFALWQLWIYGVSFLLIGFLLAPKWRRALVLTDAEFSELRYSGRPALFLRGFKAIYFGTIFNCAVLAMVLLAATRIAEPFLLWGEWLPEGVFSSISHVVKYLNLNLTLETDDPVLALKNSTSNLISIGIIVAVTTMYSMTGGLRSVIDTDVAQFAIMMIATALYAWFAVTEAGGLDLIQTQLRALAVKGDLNLKISEVTAFTPSEAYSVSWPLIAAFGLQWLIQMNSDGTGYLAQRIMCCRSDRDAKMATVVFTVSQILFRSLLWIPLGLALIVLFPPIAGQSAEVYKAHRELTFIRGMIEHLPVGVLGIMLTGMLAALASTVDTHLNWGASYWTNDIYRRIICESFLKVESKPRTLVWVARLANLLILGISLYVMTHLVSIQRAWQISLMLGAGMGIPLLLRWFWWRMNSWAEISAIVASLIGAPIALSLIGPDQTAVQLLFMATISTVAALAACYIAGPEPREHLKAFHKKVKPIGFWGPVSGSDEKRAQEAKAFFTNLLATLLAAFSIFCLLTGIGSILARSPAPFWFPFAWPWRIIVIAMGCALIPIWWRLGVLRSPRVPDQIDPDTSTQKLKETS